MKSRRLDGPVQTATPPKTNTTPEPAKKPAVGVNPAKSATTTFDAGGADRRGDLEGGKRVGYTAPNKVESPFSPEEKMKLAKKIPCPALAGLFTSGLLKVEKDGTVQIADLDRALSQIGPSSLTRAVLTHGADATDDIKGSFNLFKLNGSNLDHTGSTGIRQNDVYPEKFEELAKFSKDGETLTRQDLADAAEHFAKKDPGLRGRITQLAEMGIVLEVFGRRDHEGKLYFTIDDARSLWVDSQIPASWSPPAVPGKIGIFDVLGATAAGLFRQLINNQ